MFKKTLKELGIWGALCLSLGLLLTLYGSLYRDLFCGGHHHMECIGVPSIIYNIISFMFSLEYIGDIYLKVQRSIFSSSFQQEFGIDNVIFFVVILCIHFFLVIRPVFRFLEKFIRIVCEKKEAAPQRKKIAFFIVMLVILPSIIVTGIKWKHIPFRYSKQLITIDMWDTKLSVPRYYLKEWSIFPYPPEARGQGFNSYIGKIKATGETPFAKFHVNLSDVDPSIGLNESIRIYVRPKPFKEAKSRLTCSKNELCSNRFTTDTLSISYSFYRGYRDSYTDWHYPIIDFVESFIVEKE